MSGSASIAIGPLRLRCPPGYALSSLRTAAPAALPALEAQLRSSPEFTIYHARPYIELLAREGNNVDLVIVGKDGRFLFAMPVFAETIGCFNTGFSGILFPASPKSLRRAVQALFALLDANPHVRRFAVVQTILSAGARDAARRVLIDCLLAEQAPPRSVADIFTRVRTLDPPAEPLERVDHAGTLAPAALDGELLRSYEPDLRNQLRQAERHGLTLDFHVLTTGDDARVEAAYRDFAPMHAASWRRTGANPHTLDYWRGLSRAVTAVGGVDVVVIARDAGAIVAGVTCQLFGDAALYMSGGSLPAGLAKRANPLSLHAGLTLCRRLGVRWFELGRFEPHESEKLKAITHYKSQFGGSLHRVANLRVERSDWRPVLLDEAWRFRYRMPAHYPRLWSIVSALVPPPRS